MFRNQKRPACRQAGQSLIELVVVIAILVLVIAALTFATIASLRNAQFAKNQAQATKLAQEGLEWVRTGRDRNKCILDFETVDYSWNGDSKDISCPGVEKIWDKQVSGTIGTFCNSSSALTQCYFKISADGFLRYINSSAAFPKGFAEPIPAVSPVFERAITLSDDAAFESQKTVTAIVVWKDFSGSHESRLTTILRKK